MALSSMRRLGHGKFLTFGDLLLSEFVVVYCKTCKRFCCMVLLAE